MRAWLELFRVPNLLTVPGDPLAGWLLAVGGVWHPALLAVVAASLSFYALGLIANDILDYKTDVRERPSRPLPSKRISPIAAVSVALLLCGAAPVLAWLAGPSAFDVGVLLFLVIVLYNSMLKSVPVIGPLTMGLCRGLNLLMGAAASVVVNGVVILPHAAMLRVSVAAAILILYVAIITALARREVEAGRTHLIGALLRGLLLLQAAFCLFSASGMAGYWAAAALLLLWPLSGVLAKRFYMS